MPPHPTPCKKCARYFTCRVGMASLWSACPAVCRVNKWFADDVLRSVKGEFLPKSDLSCQTDNICWMEWYPSTIKTFLQPPLIQHRAIASWRQPLRVDGPKASQRSIITHKIHFRTDQAKTYGEGRFWFDLSYDVTGVHRKMLRIKFCWFLFVFCRKLPCLQNGGVCSACHLTYGVLWRRHNMRR